MNGDKREGGIHAYWFGLLFLVIVACLFAGYKYYSIGYLPAQTPSQQNSLSSIIPITPSHESPDQSSLEGLSGDIFVSFTKVGENAPYLYIYDVAAKSLQKAPIQAFTPRGSVDGKYIVAAYQLSTAPTTPNGIYQYNLQDSTTQLFAKSVSSLPRTPQLSPDDSMVVFNEPSAASSSMDQFHTPSFWNIYIAKKGGQARLVAHGIYPQWSPDGSAILYLGKGGLRLYNVNTGTDSDVYPVDGMVTTFLQFALSKDGTKIAWCLPHTGQVFVGNVTWSPFKITVTNQLSAYASWPVFSPDGNDLAFEQINLASPTSTTIIDPRFTVVDLKTGEYTELLDLSDVKHITFFATDWVSHL